MPGACVRARERVLVCSVNVRSPAPLRGRARMRAGRRSTCPSAGIHARSGGSRPFAACRRESLAVRSSRAARCMPARLQAAMCMLHRYVLPRCSFASLRSPVARWRCSACAFARGMRTDCRRLASARNGSAESVGERAADLPALRRRWLGVRPCVLGVLHTAARRRRQVITLLNTSAANYFGLEDSTVDIIDTFGTSQRIFEGRLDAEHTPSAAQSATNALTAAPARAAHAACIRRAASERSLAAISESCRSREPPRTRRRRACRTSRVRCCLRCSACGP